MASARGQADALAHAASKAGAGNNSRSRRGRRRLPAGRRVRLRDSAFTVPEDLAPDQRILQHGPPRQEIVAWEDEALIDSRSVHHLTVDPHPRRWSRSRARQTMRQEFLPAAPGRADDADGPAVLDCEAGYRPARADRRISWWSRRCWSASAQLRRGCPVQGTSLFLEPGEARGHGDAAPLARITTAAQRDWAC